MPDISWNKGTWDGDYDWSEMGEEWSDAWGSSRTQWISTIFPRIHAFIPCDSILEIAPGCGRWTKFLIRYTNFYCGIDVSESCTEKCKEIFAAQDTKTCFFTNDGFSLKSAKTQKYDFIFSFDSLVHSDVTVLDSYIKQITEELLNKNGVCFIHHSNMKDAISRNIMVQENDKHCRDISVSHKEVSSLVSRHGGRVLLQEVVTWGFSRLSDCFTLFCRDDSDHKPSGNPFFENPFFDSEIAYARTILNNYTSLSTKKEHAAQHGVQKEFALLSSVRKFFSHR